MTTATLADRVRAAIDFDDDARRTTANVARLDVDVRRAVANAFIGRRVELTTGRGPSDFTTTVIGYVEGTATVHHGSASDAIVLTVAPNNTHDLSRLEAYPLANVRAIREVAQP